MCIIIVKKAGVPIKQDWLDNSADSNPHGFGFSFVNDTTKELEVYKTLSYEAFLLMYNEALEENPLADMVLHFRKNTCGETTEDNCHPFVVTEGLVLYHNGAIKPCENKADTAGRSDTRIFVEEICASLPFQWERNAGMRPLLKHFIGESKLVTMDNTGHIEIINEEKGSWEEGLWVSNWSYFPFTRSLQKERPLNWQANVPQVKKTVIVEEGMYFYWAQGVKHRWDASFNSWRQCAKDTSSFEYGTPTVAGISPAWEFEYKRYVSEAYTFIVVAEKSKIPLPDENPQWPKQEQMTFLRNDTKFLKNPKNTVGECDWCGKAWHVDHMKVVSTLGRDSVVDISLMCNKCIRDFTSQGGLVGVEVVENYDPKTLIAAQVGY